MKAATVASMEICENSNLVPNPIVKRKTNIIIPLKGGIPGGKHGGTADFVGGVASMSKVETESDHNFNAIMHKDDGDLSGAEESLINIDMDQVFNEKNAYRTRS